MANPEHLELLIKGTALWNAWRRENPKIRPDLSGAVLNDPLPQWAIHDPISTNLQGANLSQANLRRCILRRANLFKANLQAADLKSADLRKANLSQADLTGASLHQTNLTLATLRDANLTGALLWETVLARVDLRNARGLAFCRHGGPSIVDHRTIRKSGDVTRVFWRGCGIPEELIKYLEELTARQAKMPSCFLSYSTKDSEFASKLYEDLQTRGIDCWMAEYDLKGGKILVDQIEEAIEEHDRTLIILSGNSIGSNWVITEIQKARKREKTNSTQILFPIRIMEYSELASWESFDSDSGEDLAKLVRQYFIPDFSAWQDKKQYAKAFEKLIYSLAIKSGKTKQRHNKRFDRSEF